MGIPKLSVAEVIQPDVRVHALPRPTLDTLQFSTIAMMMYSNTTIDCMEMIRLITPVSLPEIPRTKKKKIINKKLIRAPYGSILSARHWNIFKGIHTKENTKQWCAVTCQLTQPQSANSEKHVKVNTWEEVYTPVEGQPGVFEISYYCTNCHQNYTIHQLKRAMTFRNQLQLDVSLGDYNVNVMIFRAADNTNAWKIVGCKSFDDGFKLIDILLRHINFNRKAIWVGDKPETITVDECQEFRNYDIPSALPPMEFECRSIMFNTKFTFGVPIDREKLKHLLNRDEYKHIIKQTVEESTSNPQIKTYIYGRNLPMTKKAHKAQPGKTPHYLFARYQDGKVKYKKRPYFKYIRNDPKPADISFVTFSSSQTIVSGANVGDLEYAIHQFYDIVESHLDEIKEVLNTPGQPLRLEPIGEWSGLEWQSMSF